ncbi:MAG: nitroreductase family protein [Acidobacteria bacterium]|nr:nitroreductase family protein [Acidobacteriota bacterium]
MDIREALYTTRSMRRVKPDPIEPDAQARILDAAIRAPSGGNAQNWRFLLVDDPALRAQLGPLYRECRDELWTGVYKPRLDAAAADPEADESIQFLKIKRSADWMADNFEIYPLLMFAFAQHDPSGGSIYPAIWSAQLAARADGIGSSLTVMLAFRQAQVYEILGVPEDEGWNMAGCVPFGYPTGRWGVAQRRPAHEVAHRNQWGAPLGLTIDEPLYP